MAQKIESDKLFVKDVFQKWYRIPEYQRPYVWGADQVNELLGDVHRACQSNPEAQYFLGSMVLKKSDKQDGATKYEEYDLLDGQQRLTTLLLITAVVRDLTPKSNEVLIKTCQETIFQMANPYDNIPPRSRIVFDTRDDVKEFVETYIKSDAGTKKFEELKHLSQGSDENISIRNMASAILTIQEFFKSGNSLDEFFLFLRTKVLMIYVAAEELEDAFQLFTVMNNRGITLRHSDILKAQNLAVFANDATASRKYAITWESIEKYFAEDFDNFLSHLRTILVKQKAGYNLLKEYEDNIYAPKEYDRKANTYTSKPPLLTKGKATFDFIESYYKYYLSLFENVNYSLTNSFELDNQLALMSSFEADYWKAPLLRYYEKYKTKELLKFLYLLDAKFSSDWIIGLSPTKRIENTNAIIKEIEIATDQNFLFASSVFKVETQELLRILSGRIYGRGYGRYILLKIDLAYHGHTTPFSPPETTSIEHILPQTPDAGSQWISDFTEQDREKWINRLGNLILLSRRKNTAQGNLDYLQKKEKYFKKNVELFSNSVRIFNTFSTWNLDDLKKNHTETLVKLLSAYGIAMSDDDLKRSVG